MLAPDKAIDFDLQGCREFHDIRIPAPVKRSRPKKKKKHRAGTGNGICNGENLSMGIFAENDGEDEIWVQRRLCIVKHELSCEEELDIESDLAEGFAVAFTDGSHFEEIPACGYGAVLRYKDAPVQTIWGVCEDSQYLLSKQITGELFAVMKSVEWAKARGIPKLKIYFDCNCVIEPFDGRLKIRCPVTRMYRETMNRELAGDGGPAVTFQKVRAHRNIVCHNYADTLARLALVEYAATHGRYARVQPSDISAPLLLLPYKPEFRLREIMAGSVPPSAVPLSEHRFYYPVRCAAC